MPDKTVTMVAFHGCSNPGKPEGRRKLRQLVKKVQDEVSQQLGWPMRRRFLPSGPYQVHATLIGMEAEVVGGRLMSHWFFQNRRELRPINVRQLLRLAARVTKRKPVFRIRFGGFRKAICTCVGKSAEGWDCATSDAEFHSCDRAPWEGSFYGYPGGPVLITGWPAAHQDDVDDFRHLLYDFRLAAERAGFLDKYHSNADPHWMDDDWYVKIGSFRETLSIRKIRKVEAGVREFLRRMGPTVVPVREDDISIVRYTDPSLARINKGDCVPLRVGINDPAKVEALYA